jgi:hypothetical protein
MACPVQRAIICSFVIELFGDSVILRPVKRNAIETVETPDGERAARLNPVEVEIIHLFVQLSRALGHPCKIYNILSVSAPVIYIGPRPSHVTEILDQLDDKNSSIRGAHGEADILANQIQNLRQRAAGARRSLPTEVTAPFSKGVLLPNLISALEELGND